MLLFPIGHDETNLRKVPIVAFSLIAICVVVYLRELTLTTQEQAYAHMVDAVLYYNERADYLDMPPELEEFFEKVKIPEGLMDKLQVARDAHPRQLSRVQIEKEQAHLDELVRKAFENTTLGFFREWGLIPADMKAVSMITSLFVHAGFWHLLGNMLFLYLSGTVMEDRWGPLFFGIFYILGGVFAGVVFALTYSNLTMPLIGASDAISAVMGAFLINYWRTRIKFFYMLFFFVHGTFEAPAWIILPFWFLTQVLMAGLTHAANPEGGGGVAYLSHIAGFVFGMAVALGYAWSGLERKWSPTGIDLDSPEHNPLRAAEAEAIRGRHAKALEILAKGATEEPFHINLLLEYRNQAKELKSIKDLVRAYQKLIRATIREGRIGEAYQHWLDLQITAPQLSLNFPQSLHLAEALARNEFNPEAGEVLERLFASPHQPTLQSLEKMAAIAVLAAAPIGEKIIRTALSLPGLEDTDLSDLRELEARLQQARAKAPRHVDPEEGIALTQDEEAQRVPVTATAGREDDRENPFRDPDPRADEGTSVDSAANPVQNLDVYEAVPRAIDQNGWQLLIQGKHQKQMRFSQIKGVALGAIRQVSGRPYLVLDLIHDDPKLSFPRHRAFRIRSDSFDPCALTPGESHPGKAFLKLISFSLKKSGARPLPSQDAVLGRPFSAYADQKAFEKAIYFST